MAKIYLAGGLFNAGERLHNLYLEKQLAILGHTVILPQREAKNFATPNGFDLKALVADCQTRSSDKDSVYVGSVDGADADSGTSIEYGIAITAVGRAVIYRTDFRTALAQEAGVNGMFHAEGTEFIYQPAFFTELDEVENYYHDLAMKIHEVILKM